jgi:hypothetical protein
MAAGCWWSRSELLPCLGFLLKLLLVPFGVHGHIKHNEHRVFDAGQRHVNSDLKTRFWGKSCS